MERKVIERAYIVLKPQVRGLKEVADLVEAANDHIMEAIGLLGRVADSTVEVDIVADEVTGGPSATCDTP